MRLVRFGERGRELPGLLDADGRIRSVAGIVSDWAGEALSDASLARVAALDPRTLPLAPDGVRLGACVGTPSKFLCIGLNYADHAAETGAKVPPEPVVFHKATTAVCGPNDDVEIPPGSTKSDWEVELGVVVGARAKRVDEAEAARCIAGYCVVNDLSEREDQLERHGQWTKGKSHDTFGPLGPWLATRDEIADPADLRLWLDVDGRRFQDGSTKTMVYRPAFLVSYLSRFMTLLPGDVISTGTPPGVGLGQKPPIYLRAGQTMRLGIDGLGEQRQRTVDAP
jgi:2,4-diketo-3-deoxy-L-fuconate hydrolase